MPLENLEEEGLPKNPDLRIAQLRFLLSLPEHRGDAAVREELMAAVRDNSESARAPSQRPRPELAPRPEPAGVFPGGAPDPGAPPAWGPRGQAWPLTPSGPSSCWGSLRGPRLLSKGSAAVWALPLGEQPGGSPEVVSPALGTEQRLPVVGERSGAGGSPAGEALPVRRKPGPLPRVLAGSGSALYVLEHTCLSG